MNKKVLLNCMPPALVGIPSPGLTVIKTFLEQHGYKVDILYWNLIFNSFQRDFFNFNKLVSEVELLNILPFNAYIAIKMDDEVLIDKIISRILYEKPQYHIKGRDFLKEKLRSYALQIDDIFDNEIKLLDMDTYDLVGISFQFYQWIPGNILIDKIKELNNKLKVIIGGFGTKESAHSYLNNFKNFDFAIWGEGEYPILRLLDKAQLNSNNFEDVSNLVYREKGSLVISNARCKYVDINNTYKNDFSDYFHQIEKNKLDDIIRIPVETGRGCHWNKCHFCYLNTGYKFRNKAPQNIVNEIESYNSLYGINKFIFLDNDTIGNNVSSFKLFLNLLISFRDKHPGFEVFMAEIITKNIDYEVINGMKLANFRNLQIGYESPSNQLLKKIDKKNTFASNTLFIKWAFYLRIGISGLNIITNLLEETTEDINEGIDNLLFLRFYLKRNIIEHNHSTLSITASSRYFKSKKKYNIGEWDISPYLNFLPENFVRKEDEFYIYDFLKLSSNPAWDIFKKVESHYLDSYYEYKLIRNDNLIIYLELLNNEKINELSFDTNNSMHWNVLCFCNKRVVSIDDISLSLKMNRKEAENILIALNKEGLLYSSVQYEENVTIINTDFIY